MVKGLSDAVTLCSRGLCKDGARRRLPTPHRCSIHWMTLRIAAGGRAVKRSCCNMSWKAGRCALYIECVQTPSRLPCGWCAWTTRLDRAHDSSNAVNPAHPGLQLHLQHRLPDVLLRIVRAAVAAQHLVFIARGIHTPPAPVTWEVRSGSDPPGRISNGKLSAAVCAKRRPGVPNANQTGASDHCGNALHRADGGVISRSAGQRCLRNIGQQLEAEACRTCRAVHLPSCEALRPQNIKFTV
jgi:hypothetical protein